MKIEKNKIILIANSDLVFDINNQITPQDIIVRFNIPKSSTLTRTTYRTDFLFVANTVDLLHKKLNKKSKFMKFIQNMDNNFKIIFPYSDQLIKKNKPYYRKKSLFRRDQLCINYNNTKYYKILTDLGYKVSILPEQIYLNLKDKVNLESDCILSTGLIALDYFMNNPNFKMYEIYLHGFSFEGWKGHAWDKEKLYISDLINQKKVFLFNEN